MLAAFVLSMLTAALFLLRSGPVASGTCSTLIMIQAECIKLVVALMYIIPRGQLGRITKSIPLALVPVSAYVAVNLLSFWALKYVHASLGALMSQIKLPATAIFSRIFLGRETPMHRTFALVTIFLGSLGIAAFGQLDHQNEASPPAEGPDDPGRIARRTL